MNSNVSHWLTHRVTASALALTLLILTAPSAYTKETQRKKGAKAMHSIRITVDGKIVQGVIEDNPTAREFLAQLPLTTKLEDYSSTEKITYLSKKLSTQGAPAGCDPDVGDITYYAPWGNLAIFYKDFGYSQGLIKLGRITSGIEHLKYQGSKNATIELVSGP